MKPKEINDIYNHHKNSAKSRNIPFTMTKQDFMDLSYPITCPILGMPLQWNKGTPQDNSYSLDRIESSKGYEPDNVVVISHRANILKRDATLEEMKLLYEYYSQM